MRFKTVRTLVLPAALAALVAAVLVQQGCYRRVVGARGLGASNYEISEPYQENSALDDWIFGERNTTPDKIVRPKPVTP